MLLHHVPITRPHFSDEDWADFVRGTLPSERRIGLQGHLDASCTSCTKVHETWQAIQEVAGTAMRDEPSPDAVRVVRALFGLRKPAAPTSPAAAMVRLLFDSQMLTAASGIRSATAAPRKSVYTFGNYVLDVQIQDDAQGRPTQLIGQLTGPGDQDPALEGAPVLLLREMAVIARATMNRFGEFHMPFDGIPTGMSLAIALKSGGTVIPLDMTRTQS